MPLRDKVSLNINAGHSVAPDVVGSSRAKIKGPSKVMDNAGLRQAMQGLLGLGEQLAEDAAKDSAEEAYMEGERARMEGKSVDDIDTDIFSKPFARGGYNTADYRMTQAEFMQEMKDFINGDGKELDPEAFIAKMRESAENTMTKIKDVPSNQRAKALMQQRGVEEQLVNSHNTAYKQNNIQQKAARYNAQFNTFNTALTDSVGKGTEAQALATNNMYSLVTDVLESDALPSDMRPRVASNYIKSMLAAGNHEAVEVLLDNGILDKLPLDKQDEIYNGIRVSKNNYRARDLLGTYGQDAQFESALINGQIDDPAQIETYINDGVLNKGKSPEWAMGIWSKFHKGASDHQSWENAFTALQSGDINELERLGFGVDEVLMKLDQQLAKGGMSHNDRTMMLYEYGARYGEVPQMVGKRVGSAIGAMTFAIASGGDVHPEHAELMRDVTNRMVQETALNPESNSHMLAAVPKEFKPAFTRMLNDARNGVDPLESLRQQQVQVKEYGSKTNVERWQMSKAFEKRMRESVAPEGFWDGVWQSSETTILPNMADNTVVRSSLAEETRKELNKMSTDQRYNALFDTDTLEESQDLLLAEAVARVKSRTIIVDKPKGSFALPGVTHMRDIDQKRNKGAVNFSIPEGVSANDIFGNGMTLHPARRKRLGEELANRFPPEVDGYTSTFKVMGGKDGGVLLQQVDEDGVMRSWRRLTQSELHAVGKSVLDAERVIMQRNARAQLGDPVNGTMTAVDSATGDTVALNVHGRNTANVKPTRALSLRARIADFFGFNSDERPKAMVEQDLVQETNTAMRNQQKVARQMQIANTVDVVPALAEVSLTHGDDVANAMAAVISVETGPFEDSFIRTKFQPAGGSSAYGPLQVTKTLAQDYRKRHADIFDADELTYLDAFIEQGKQFLKRDDEATFAYGGPGVLTSEDDRAMYMQVMSKIFTHNLDGDYSAKNIAKTWHGGTDPALIDSYAKKLRERGLK